MTPQQLWLIAGGVVGGILLIILLLFWQSGTWLQSRLVNDRDGIQPTGGRLPLEERYQSY